MYNLKKKETHFLKAFAGTFFIIFFLVISFNYIFDSFLIFHQQTTLFQTSFEPNSRVLKTKYLRKNCDRFDAMIFGNSRVVAYQTKDINQQFGVRSYNFGVALETPQGIMQKLEWLDSKKCVPKTVFLAVSSGDYTKKPFNLITMEHPSIVKKNLYWLDFLTTYLTSKSVTTINAKKLLNHYDRKIRLKYDISAGDVYYLWDNEFLISKCGRSYRTSSEKIALSQKTPEFLAQQTPEFLFQPEEYAAQLTKIKKFTEERGSKLVLIWNPLPLDFQIKNLDKTEIFLKNISLHFEFLYRLPLSNKKLLSSFNYHDKSHFKPSLAKEVILPQNRTFVRNFLDEFKKHQGSCELIN
jgi:hypothetical protein